MDLLQWLGGFPEGLSRENFLLENLSYLATTIGLPILFVSWVATMNSEAERREYGTYDLLESKYVEFQELALRFARLDVAEFPLTNPPRLDDEELVQQRVLYMILFSLFERSWLMYRSRFHLWRGRTRAEQWNSWESYIRRYCERQSCYLAWFNHEPPKADVRQDFDDRFERYMLTHFERAESARRAKA